jgi:hypothetical protein
MQKGATMDNKKRIMDMVKENRISVEEALKLLEALEQPGAAKGSPQVAVLPNRPVVAQVRAVSDVRPGIARMIRIAVEGEEVKVKVNVPAALAKFAANFIPSDVQQRLASQGLDIANILDMLKGELPEGRIVDVEVSDMAKMSNGDGDRPMKGPMKVIIEVV